jgi:hypothetical protein
MTQKSFSAILALALPCFLCLSVSAQQPATAPPGGTIQFATPSNGDIKRSDDPRIKASINGSNYTVRASVISVAGGNVTSFAFLYNEFKVTGDTPRAVSAQISATAKWNGKLIVGGLGGANASADIALTLIDVTAGFRQVGAVSILSAKATQPISVPIPGGSSQTESGEQAISFRADLVRGHTYRLQFRLDCAADGTAGTAASEFHDDGGEAKLSNLTVQVGADTVELLEMIKDGVGALADEVATIKVAVENIRTVVNERLDVAVSTRASQTSVNNVQNTVNIVNAKVDDLADKLMKFQRDALRSAIEAALVEGNRYNVTWYQTPRAAGGHLELVREIVEETINEAVKAGRPDSPGSSINEAQDWLARGDALYAAKAYKDAYESYRTAYLHLSIVPGNHRP